MRARRHIRSEHMFLMYMKVQSHFLYLVQETISNHKEKRRIHKEYDANHSAHEFMNHTHSLREQH